MALLPHILACQCCGLASRTIHLPNLQRYASNNQHCRVLLTIVDEKGLSEETVAFLFLIGFVSAGISASFAGTFADRYGRKTACLAYCVLYSFSSFTLLADDIRILFLGRVLGGICGTLLWSVFESWLVAEFNQLMLEDTSPVLGGIFSAMTILNSLVAICAGILAEWLVGLSGTAKAPFLASIGCLSVAFVAISKIWVCKLIPASDGVTDCTG